jgi:hypothetical protein
VRLPPHNAQKIRRLFRGAFRGALRKPETIPDPQRRAQRLVDAARETLERGVRAVAVIDYYLKHVDDERQLESIDRWLAEELLSRALQRGHSKNNFRKIPFRQLRAMGLPSLRHRRRLLRRGKLKRPVVVLRSKSESSEREAAARSRDLFSMSRSSGAQNPVRKGTACS